MGDQTKDRFGYKGVMGNNSAERKLLKKIKIHLLIINF